jgi:hypothetical protein
MGPAVRRVLCARVGGPGVDVRLNDGSIHTVVAKNDEDALGAWLDFNGITYWVSDRLMVEVLPLPTTEAAHG